MPLPLFLYFTRRRAGNDTETLRIHCAKLRDHLLRHAIMRNTPGWGLPSGSGRAAHTTRICTAGRFGVRKAIGDYHGNQQHHGAQRQPWPHARGMKDRMLDHRRDRSHLLPALRLKPAGTVGSAAAAGEGFAMNRYPRRGRVAMNPRTLRVVVQNRPGSA